MKIVPERKLKRDLRDYDDETRRRLSRMRSENKDKAAIAEVERDRALFREEYSGPLWERQYEDLVREGRKFGVYVEDVYGDDEEVTFSRDNFGARWLKDERKFRKALHVAREEAAKESRERWAWRSGLIFGVIGSLTALVGTFSSSKGAIIEILQAVIKAWKG